MTPHQIADQAIAAAAQKSSADDYMIISDWKMYSQAPDYGTIFVPCSIFKGYVDFVTLRYAAGSSKIAAFRHGGKAPADFDKLTVVGQPLRPTNYGPTIANRRITEEALYDDGTSVTLMTVSYDSDIEDFMYRVIESPLCADCPRVGEVIIDPVYHDQGMATIIAANKESLATAYAVFDSMRQ